MHRYHQHSADTTSSSSSGLIRPGDIPQLRRPLCHSNPGSGEGERSRPSELSTCDRPSPLPTEIKCSPSQTDDRTTMCLTVTNPLNVSDLTVYNQPRKLTEYLSDGSKPPDEADKRSTVHTTVKSRSPSPAVISNSLEHYPIGQKDSKSEDELNVNAIAQERPPRLSHGNAQKVSRVKTREAFTGVQTIASPQKQTGRSSRTRFKHQNSSPLVCRSRTPHERRASPYVSTDTSFLSSLAASRPNAATGLLGVASAALAAARAGTLTIGPHIIDEPPRIPYESSSAAMAKRYSAVQPSTQSAVFVPCHCQHQVCTYNEPHFFQPRVDGTNLTKMQPLRRNSDSVLEVTTYHDFSPAVHVIICPHCKRQQLDVPKSFQSGICQLCPAGHCTCDSYEPFVSNERNMSLIENTLDPSRSYLHSSWVGLSGNECPDFIPLQPDTNRATSTAVLTGLSAEFEPDSTELPETEFDEPETFQPFIVSLSSNYPDRGFAQKPVAERFRSTSRDRRSQGQTNYYTSGYNRLKPRGLDAIGLDFMRINGARPGLLQLRHVKEFKAAKEMEHKRDVKKEQSQDAIHKLRTSKQTSFGKGSSALGLLVHGQPTNQQNPFHQLISGGVLGATVLAIAGKERLPPGVKDQDKASSSGKPVVESITSPGSAAEESRQIWTELEANMGDGDLRPAPKLASNRTSLARLFDHNTEKNSLAHMPEHTYDGSKLSVKGAASSDRKSDQSLNRESTGMRSGSSAMSSKLQKLRNKLTRSITVSHSSSDADKSQLLKIGKGSIVSLQGTLSAPGLSRCVTQDREGDHLLDETDKDHYYANSVLKPASSSPARSVLLADFRSSGGTHENQNRVRIVDSQRDKNDSFGDKSTTDSCGLEMTVHHHPLASSRDSIGVVESGSAKSKRYFTSHVPLLCEAGSTTSSPSTGTHPPGISSSANSLSRAKRRRDNFQKGRSSAFTWIPSDTIGERTESPLSREPIHSSETVLGTEKKLSVISNVIPKLPDPLVLIHQDTKQDAAMTKESPYKTCKILESPQTYPIQTRMNSTEHLVKQLSNRKRSSDIPLLQVEEFTQAEELSSEVSQLQRRRDAMNNQHQQRTIRNVGYRLGRRKRLFEKRCRISDFALTFALFGIFVMLVETELTFAGIYRKDSIYSYFAKSLVSISTLLLLGLILTYHVYVIKIFSSDDSIEDWRMAVDCNRIGQMALELIVCLIHPFPGSDAIQFPISPSYVGPVTDFHPYTFPVPVRPVELDPGPLIRFNRSTVITKSNSRSPLGHVPTGPSTHNSGFNITSGSALYPYKIVSIDLILSVPMFLRLYLLFRAMLLHSKLFTDAGSRSIGAMNKVNFDMRFIFKTLMTMCPGKLLLGFILCLWIIYSWSLRACESFFEKEQGNLLNSMWLIAVTFLSIGYGDIVPHTYCGRAIALATGVMGSACTALIVAVFARKLELSKAEKHVIHFMMENQLNKKVKNYAANVLRETWLIYKYTKLAKRVDASKVRAHQRKFLRAIHGLRRMKLDQRKVQDSANTLVDLAKTTHTALMPQGSAYMSMPVELYRETQTNIYETVSDLRIEQNCLNHRMEALESTLLKLQDQLRALPSLLRTTLIQQHYAYQKYSNNRNTESISTQNPQNSVEHRNP